MRLTFLGKNSTPDNSPTLYATDENSYVVQGWVVDDAAILATLTVLDDETLVEVPPGLFEHLTKDGLNGVVSSILPPIVATNDAGNYIIQGKQVHDRAVLDQMNLPDHETCVLVTKVAVAALVGG